MNIHLKLNRRRRRKRKRGLTWQYHRQTQQNQHPLNYSWQSLLPIKLSESLSVQFTIPTAQYPKRLKRVKTLASCHSFPHYDEHLRNGQELSNCWFGYWIFFHRVASFAEVNKLQEIHRLYTFRAILRLCLSALEVNLTSIPLNSLRNLLLLSLERMRLQAQLSNKSSTTRRVAALVFWSVECRYEWQIEMIWWTTRRDHCIILSDNDF